MKKTRNPKSPRKLTLHRETLRLLEDRETSLANGGLYAEVALCPSDECTNDGGASCCSCCC